MATTTTPVPSTSAPATTLTDTTAGRAPMSATRKAALAGGIFYLLTFVTSIPALGFYDDVLNDPNFILGAGSAGGVPWGALLEVLCGLTGIGTAVALYSVVRRHGERSAIGFVGSRVLEASMIFVGAISLLAVYTLRQDASAASDPDALRSVGQALVAVHDWTFLFGPGVMPAVNAICLATVLYRSRLVPRLIPTMGLIGAPMLLASSTASLFGAYDQVSSQAMLMALPIAAWEFSLGVWLVVKGFTGAKADDEPTVVTGPVRDHVAV